MTHEIELKLDLNAKAAKALRRHSLLDGHPNATSRQSSIYYDTADGALREAGFALRVRESGGRHVQTIKQSCEVSAGLFDRPEWEDAVATAGPDMAAVDRTPLGALITRKQRKALKPVVTTDVARTIWLLPVAGGQVEVTLDSGTVSAGAKREPLTEVELELKQGGADCLMGLARTLALDVPLRIGVMSKVERGFALAEGKAGKPVKAEPVLLRPEMTAAEGFAAIAHACLRHFRRNEALVVGRHDPGALHQARVAMRRFRSAFTLFRPVVTDEEYERLRTEIRWFTGQLGDARNLDVLIGKLGSGGRDPAGRALRKALKAERAQAYGRVVGVMESPRLRALMLDLVAWIETGAWRQSEAAPVPLAEFAAAQLGSRWRKVRKGGRQLAALDEEQLHRLRIEVKKLRYAIEFLASLQEDEGARGRQKAALAALEEMQEQLGEINDRQTATALLDALLAGHGNRDAMMGYADKALKTGKAGHDEIAQAGGAYMDLLEAGKFWRKMETAAPNK